MKQSSGKEGNTRKKIKEKGHQCALKASGMLVAPAQDDERIGLVQDGLTEFLVVGIVVQHLLHLLRELPQLVDEVLAPLLG